ncbi:hypothetical protein [Rhizobium gallicum]|nr:hypothetical protein [Rhizobium gallicum]
MQAAARNGFPATSFVIDLSAARSFRRLSCLHEGAAAEDLDRLVGVLGLRTDVEHVKNLLSDERNNSRDWSRLGELKVRRSQIVSHRRVAPRSLKLAERQKRIWALRPFSFDLETGERLLDHCPVCGRQLGWARSYGVSFCDKCHDDTNTLRGAVDLRAFEQEIVEFRDVEAIGLFRSQIEPDATSTSRRLHSDFSAIGRGELFHLAVSVGAALGKRSRLKPLDVEDIEKAGRALLEWPSGFDDLLDQIQAEDPHGRGMHPLHKLQNDPTLSRQTRALLKRRVDFNLRSGAISRLSKQGDQSVANFNSGHFVGRTVLAGMLAKHEVEMGQIALSLLRSSAQCRKLSADLGLPFPWLLDLVAAGLLPELSGMLANIVPSIQNPPIALIDSICKLPSTRPDEHTISVSSALFTMTDISGAQCAAVLRDICTGALPAYVDQTSALPVWQRLRCRIDDVLTSVDKCATAAALGTHALFTKNDVAMALGKNPRIARELIVQNFLPATVTAKDVTVFRRDWMFTTEIVDRIRLEGTAAPGAVRRSLLSSPVVRQTLPSATLWSRAGVTEFLSGSGLVDLKAIRGRTT